MKTLYLLRHAEASRKDGGMTDQERPLTARGRRQARAVAEFMENEGLLPDRALISTALRTRETWELMAPSLGGGIEADLRESLYLADPGSLLEEVRGANHSAQSLLLVGHNPGIWSLARGLVGEGAGPALARLGASFPTAALAVITFPVDRWSDVAPGEGTLQRFVGPGD